MINLVATRLKAGTPAQLLRWYNDHIHLLMRFDGLRGATLYGCTTPGGLPPEYVCLYDFASPAAFAAFEASAAKAAASRVTQTGWGQHGIEIVQRTQYAAGGQYTGNFMGNFTGQAAPGASFHIQCLNITDAPANDDADSTQTSPEDTQRWLADSLYLAAQHGNISHVAWWATHTAPGQQQAVVLAQFSRPTPDWASWWGRATTQRLATDMGESWGQAPDAITVNWQAGYERLGAWGR
jgi:hypothetical protein